MHSGFCMLGLYFRLWRVQKTLSELLPQQKFTLIFMVFCKIWIDFKSYFLSNGGILQHKGCQFLFLDYWQSLTVLSLRGLLDYRRGRDGTLHNYHGLFMDFINWFELQAAKNAIVIEVYVLVQFLTTIYNTFWGR